MPADWLNGLVGGLLIGLSAALLLLLNGRIAGISGIVGSLRKPDAAWRWAFIGGMVGAAFLWRLGVGPLDVTPVRGMAGMAVAGLLVGIGTAWGCGCTSGHGIVGLARGRRRSIVATGVFMSTAIFVVWLERLL